MREEDRESGLQPNSLVLYKNHPARVTRMGERLEVELESGEVARVRAKDVVLLHPGPLHNLNELKTTPQGEVLAAWEILEDSETNLAELSELAFGAYTPLTAWATWQQVMSGFHFSGSPQAIKAHPAAEVAHLQQEREQAASGRRAWQTFLDHVRQGQVEPADHEFLRDTEALALGRGERSQVLRALNQAETPDNAHALLLKLGVWERSFNPYPIRLGLPVESPKLQVPPLPEEARRDLTHLPAFAIDDEGTDTPDDAISLEGSRIWVHVADVAALVPPDSPLDLEARERASSLHLPEGTIHLLPREVTQVLGLGLSETNPALSFGIDLSDEGEVVGFEVVPSQVRVTRLTYEAAEEQMAGEPFHTLAARLAAVREQRRRRGAVMIDFPEIKLTVEDGQVMIRPVLPLNSRAMVEEAMILAGTASAQEAIRRELPVPFSHQEAVESEERPETLSGMFALRRLLKRSRVRSVPGPHNGLGVPAYTQTTSPLRRYLDLVAHQQWRASLQGGQVIGETGILERIATVESVLGSVRQAEILSNKHWTLVYLLQNPDWRGEGIVVDRRGGSGIVIVPELAIEGRVYLPGSAALDGRVMLQVSGIDLAQREVVLQVERGSARA